VHVLAFTYLPAMASRMVAIVDLLVPDEVVQLSPPHEALPRADSAAHQAIVTAAA
jgi:hypothetical protein